MKTPFRSCLEEVETWISNLFPPTERVKRLTAVILTWLGVGLHLWVYFPTLQTSTMKVTLQGPNDWFDYTREFLNTCEQAAKGSTGNMLSKVPEKWPYGKTDYYVSIFGYCRKSEGSKPVCHRTLAQYPFEVIMRDIGSVIAEQTLERKLEIKKTAENWKDQSILALNQAIRASLSGEVNKYDKFKRTYRHPIDGFSLALFTIVFTSIALVMLRLLVDTTLLDCLFSLIGPFFHSWIGFFVIFFQKGVDLGAVQVINDCGGLIGILFSIWALLFVAFFITRPKITRY